MWIHLFGRLEIPRSRSVFRVSRFHRYRILVVIYSIGIFVGIREYSISRTRERPVDFLAGEGSVFTDVMIGVNPKDPDTDFLRAMRALSESDEEGFSELLEKALSADIKHNELLLQFHAQHLLNQGAETEEINRALNRWHQNFPFSERVITVSFATGPTAPYEAVLLENALSEIPWVADSEFDPYDPESSGGWRLRLMFRRGEIIDIGLLTDVPSWESLISRR